MTQHRRQRVGLGSSTALGVALALACMMAGGCEATLHLGLTDDVAVDERGDTEPGGDAEPGDTSAADLGDGAQDDTSTGDTRPGLDTSGGDTAGRDTSGIDTQVTDPCAGVVCGANAHCASGACACDAGFVDVGGACVPPDPCQGVTCGTNAHCSGGACVCDGGFVDAGGACVPPDPSDPAQRTVQQVCDRWRADWSTRSSKVYDPGAGSCDPGTIDPTAHDDAMRRLNLYRWLIGLDPAGVDWGHQALCQAAARMMDANNALSHAPPTGWTCYSTEGATAAGSSNLALGNGHPADTVDMYIDDRWSADLGHRRWCFNPSLDQVGFGHYGRGGAMWAFGSGSHREPDYVAYPGPGPFPVDAIQGVWSFHRRNAFSNPQVTVTRQSDGVVLNTNAVVRGSSYGWLATISIEVLDAVAAGQSYRVEVVDGGNSWSYVTQLVTCP